MSVIQSRPLSGEELERLAEMPGVEYAHGQIVEKPSSMEIADIEATIIYLLNTEARKSKTANVFTQSLGFRCFSDDPAHFRKPDVSVIKIARIVEGDWRSSLTNMVPDLAVEVISPNDKNYNVEEKVEEYLDAGFPLIWVVHPNTRTVTIRRGDRSAEVLDEEDEISGETALPGFKCKVGEFFGSVE